MRIQWSRTMWQLRSNLPNIGSLTLVQQMKSPEIITFSSPFILWQMESFRSKLQAITKSMLKALEPSCSRSTDQVWHQWSQCSITSCRCLHIVPLPCSVLSSEWGKMRTSSSIWTEYLQVPDQYLSTTHYWSTVYWFPQPLLPHWFRSFSIQWIR
jgi:hypothetical protein